MQWNDWIAVMASTWTLLLPLLIWIGWSLRKWLMESMTGAREQTRRETVGRINDQAQQAAQDAREAAKEAQRAANDARQAMAEARRLVALMRSQRGGIQHGKI